MRTSAAESTPVRDPTLGRDILAYVRYQVRGRRGIILAAVALAAPGLWIGWPWLMAAGIAPLLILLAPCAIMCTLGLCMKGKDCSKADAGASSDASALQRTTITAVSEPSTSSAASCTNCDSSAEAEAPVRRVSTH